LRIEAENKVKLDDEFKLQTFTEVFLEREQDIYYDDYRLSKDDETEIEWEKDDAISNVPTAKISSLPPANDDREEFIKAANQSFERVFSRIEPDNPELTRSLWNAEKYIDEDILTSDRLPIDLDYALSMIDAFMVGYVIQLATEADNQTEHLN
jgi:hypothetical protein